MGVRDQVKDLLRSYRSIQTITLAPSRLTPINELVKVLETSDPYPIFIIPPPIKAR
jgi:hypothetical protein